MKALILKQPNTAFESIELAKKRPSAGEVLIRIHHSGVNPLDLKIHAGAADHAKVTFPATLGIDLSGIIEEVGRGVSEFKVGDEVYGMAGGIGGLQGTLAEYLTVDANLIAHRPVGITSKEAAALPLIFITAWEGLVDRAKVQSGMKVLIHGGAGGVGHMAVQIARSFGAHVFASGKKAQKEVIESFGATFIDNQNTSVDEYLELHTSGEGFDIVYDTVGGETLDASFVAAKQYTGHVVSCLGWGTHKLAPLSFRAATYSGVFTLLPMLTGKGRKHHSEILKEAAYLTESGKLRVLLDPNSFQMEEIGEAYARIQSGKAQGKIVIEVIKR